MEYFVWNVDPNIFQFGSIQLRWYGVLFVSSFFIGIWILEKIYKRENKDSRILENFLIYIIIGVVVGARLAHCLFYEPEYYLSHPLEILFVWKGGLASHGGMIGAIVAIYVFANRYDESPIWLISRVTMPGMLTAAFVRIGNLFNSEILGVQTDVPWAIVFQRIDSVPRHPVQLYEAFSYLILLAILVAIYRKSTFEFATKILPGVFLTMMFTVRFMLEFTKTRQAAYATDIPLSTGQMLSIPFVLLGILWIVWAFFSSAKGHRWKHSH